MDFHLGKISMTPRKTMVLNKTRKYLFPILKEYGEDFKNKFNSIFKVACGIGDTTVAQSGVIYEKHLFLLVDSSIKRNVFLDFMDWIKNEPYYEDDYVFGNIVKSDLHMFVLKIPDKFLVSLEIFKLGKYSKMYSFSEINLFFNNYPEVQKVLTRDPTYKIEFIALVNKEFQTNIEDFDIEDYELDFPANKKEEIF